MRAFEPVRSEEFYSLKYRQEILKKEMLGAEEKTAFYFYIMPVEQPDKIIGILGLSNVVWGAFCSAFLGGKLDKDFINEGISKYYLKINGVWEDHIHMVKINYAMH